MDAVPVLSWSQENVGQPKVELDSCEYKCITLLLQQLTQLM